MTQRTESQEASHSQTRHPASETTREEFLNTEQRTSYRATFRLTQTQRVGEQVEIHELVEFAEDLRWVIKDEYNIPIEYWNVDDHDISITLGDLPLATIDDRGFENAVEAVAEEHDIGLRKTIGLSRPGERVEGGVFVQYSYGWGDKNHLIDDPHCPTGRVDWVGGFRGQPETMEESNLRIVSVESKEITHPRLHRLRNWLASLV